MTDYDRSVCPADFARRVSRTVVDNDQFQRGLDCLLFKRANASIDSGCAVERAEDYAQFRGHSAPSSLYVIQLEHVPRDVAR